MNENKILIVIYPYKFSEFLWHNLELDLLSQFVKVEVWDISIILNKRFSKGIFAQSFERSDVKLFSSIKEFIKYKIDFSREYALLDKYYLNEISLSSLKSIFLYKLILNRVPGKRILELINPGIPTDYEVSEDGKHSAGKKIADIYKLSTTKREILFRLMLTLTSKIGRLFLKSGTFKLIAGTEWQRVTTGANLRKNVQVINGHSNDISKCINMQGTYPTSTRTNRITHLDMAGPMFETDSLLIHRKTYTTVENWYPQLCRFFEKLEQKYGFEVTIAGHYKSGFTSPSPIFDNREVIYGETFSLISESLFVTTQYSSATSIAVYLKKPILFIYSDELLNDNEAMQHVLGFSNLLKSPRINIDRIGEINELEIKLDQKSYDDYLTKYLSSGDMNMANYRLILTEFLEENCHEK